MTEIAAAVLDNWDALDQSRVNGFLLLFLILSVGAAFWGIKMFVNRIYEGIRSDIHEAVGLAKEALQEIRELKLTERDHDGDIKRLKEDVDDLFGRTRKRKP